MSSDLSPTSPPHCRCCHGPPIEVTDAFLDEMEQASGPFDDADEVHALVVEVRRLRAMLPIEVVEVKALEAE